jgi:apolipoprotein N-acyltransferase
MPVLARLDLGREGVLDSPLPAALPPTPYARLNDVALLILLAGALGTIFVISRAR